MTSARVSVVLVSWNCRADLIQCLLSLSAVDYANFEIILVDNGSRDGSVEAGVRTSPSLTVIRNPSNLGFAEANNQGIRLARQRGSRYVLMLNCDTVVKSTLLSELVAFADANPTVAFCGPLINDYADRSRITSAGGTIDWRNASPETIPSPISSEPYDVDWASGCSLMVRLEFLDRIGLLDSRYFAYFEETDWCTRARRAGYRVAVYPTTLVFHKEGGATGGKRSPLFCYYYTRNRLLFASRNAPRDKSRIVIRLLRYDVLADVCRYARSYASGRGKIEFARLRATFCATRDFFLHKWGRGPAWLHRKV